MTSEQNSEIGGARYGPTADPLLLNKLLSRAAGGDREAFTCLYDLTSSRIYGLAVRIVRDRHLAEEVVQEAYLQFWQQAGNYVFARGPVISWMMTIAHRRAVDRVRRENMQAERISEYGSKVVEPDTPRNLPLEAVLAAGERHTLMTCLGQLTDLQRACIEMSYFGNLSYPEVATRLGTPLPTAKSRIRDGLRRLRLCMDATRDV